jgi:hypothetical protein
MYIAVDFDGTVVESKYPLVGKDVPHAAGCLHGLARCGHKLILWTVRNGYLLDDAAQWFDDKGIPLHGVNCNPGWTEGERSPKVFADVYIDDCAVGCPLIQVDKRCRPVVDWLKVMELLEPRLGTGKTVAKY